MVPLFQIPLWLTLSHSYRGLALLFPDPTNPAAILAHEQLQHEGLFWFQNLTMPDPTGILPLASVLVNLAVIQLFVFERRKKKIKDSLFTKLITNGSRLVSLALLPIGLASPACMPFYWTVSASMGFLQNYLLLKPQVKEFFNIKEPIEKESEDKLNLLKNK